MTGTAQVARILIRGGRVYDHDGDIHQPAQADILIGGERIERIGSNLPAEAGVEVIDAAGKLVVPGFVNAHYHSHDVMAKGLFEKCFGHLTLLTANYGPQRTLVGAGRTTPQRHHHNPGFSRWRRRTRPWSTRFRLREEAGVRLRRRSRGPDIALFILKIRRRSVRTRAPTAPA